MRKIIKITVIALIIFGIVGFSLYFYITNNTSHTPSVDSTDTSLEVTEPLPPLISQDSRMYKNLLLRFSLVYPENLKVKEFNDGTSASTITFEDVSKGEGFQIFVVPYVDDYINEAQFRKDIPSGVASELTDIIIDNTKAVVFYSKDESMNDTREVWFIKNGFLYEITTYKELDAWLAEIMKTWHFLPPA